MLNVIFSKRELLLASLVKREKKRVKTVSLSPLVLRKCPQVSKSECANLN